jgi:hypothetical protein
VCLFALLNVEPSGEIPKTPLKYTRSVEQGLPSSYSSVTRKYPKRKIRSSRALSELDCVALSPLGVPTLFVKLLRAEGSVQSESAKLRLGLSEVLDSPLL